jgi:hypothetical protein
MGFERLVELALGFGGLALGILIREFKPAGWTTRLVWGKSEDARIPSWIGSSFYVLAGVFFLYLGFTGK